jgi:DNA primase
VSLYEQLQERLHGHPYNGYFTCVCQFHDDHSPSMFVYEDGYYSCKTCHAHGSLEKLNKALGGKSVKATTRNIVSPRWRKWEEQHGDMEGIAAHAHLSLKRFPQWNFYFKERKIEKFVEKGKLGYIDGWATFPVFSPEGVIQNIVVRHTKNKARYSIKPVDDKTPLLYCPNWHRVNSSDIVYVVYGIIDAISLELLGLSCVTGITGKSLSAETLKPLHKHFIIVPDEYEEQDAHRLANDLGFRASVKRLSFPDGTKDPDGIRVKFGNEYLLQALGI